MNKLIYTIIKTQILIFWIKNSRIEKLNSKAQTFQSLNISFNNTKTFKKKWKKNLLLKKTKKKKFSLDIPAINFNRMAKKPRLKLYSR